MKASSLSTHAFFSSALVLSLQFLLSPLVRAQAGSTPPSQNPNPSSTRDLAGAEAAERRKRFDELKKQMETDLSENSSPAEILQRAFEAQLRVRSLRVRHTDVNTWAKRTLLIEWSPGRTHQIPLEELPAGTRHAKLEEIEIGPSTYVRLPTGLWREINYAGRVTNQPNIRKDVAKFLDLRNGTFLGVEELDGYRTRVFKAGHDRAPDSSPGFYVKIWISRDGLPRQVESISGDWKTIDRYFDYNADIDIKPPR